MAASSANLIDLRKVWKFATIGPDKLNQLRQARFFRNESGIEAHMARHARLLRPKFEQVISIFREELDGSSIASWTEPRGGYFLSFDTMPGCAAARWSFAAGPVSRNSPPPVPPGPMAATRRTATSVLPPALPAPGDRTCSPAVYRLRAACHTGKAGGYPLCIRNRPWRGAHRLNFRSLAVLHKHRSFSSPSKPHRTARFV